MSRARQRRMAARFGGWPSGRILWMPYAFGRHPIRAMRRRQARIAREAPAEWPDGWVEIGFTVEGETW